MHELTWEATDVEAGVSVEEALQARTAPDHSLTAINLNTVPYMYSVLTSNVSQCAIEQTALPSGRKFQRHLAEHAVA